MYTARIDFHENMPSFEKKEDAERWIYDYQTAMLAFLRDLFRNGLILEGGRTVSELPDGYSCRVIAVDANALSKKEMGYDARLSLKKIAEMSKSEPEAEALEECVVPAHCVCARPSHLVLQASPEWEGTPVMCGDCGKSMPLYRLVPDVNEREFDDLYGWRRLYRGYLNQHLVGVDGIDYHQSYAMLNECVSTLNLIGRRFAGLFERFSGIPTYYPIFSRYEKISDLCPQCAQPWKNHYTSGIKFSHVCEHCRLVSGSLF